jgi:hypothetical protein
VGTTIARRLATALTVAVLLTGTGCGDNEQATIRSETVQPAETDDESDGLKNTDTTSEDPASDTSGDDEGPGTAAALGEPFVPRPGPTTDEGMPSTVIAVTDDTYELVELDAVDGRVVRTLGSTGAVDDESGNFIDGARWHPATGVVVVSDGPEPAAGNLTLVKPGEDYDGQGGPQSWGPGWDMAISPDGRFALTTGYGADVAMLAGGDGGRNVVVDLVDSPDEAFRYHPAWLRDRIGVAMVREVDGVRNLIDVIELGGDGRVASTVTYQMDRPIADLEVRSDGGLVVLYDDGRNPFGGGTRAVVVDPDSGEIKAEFDLEEGSHSLAYDATGRLLLYVDGESTVRWQGVGDSGVLAEGYIHADW